jgi:hypothetical protein
MGLMALFGVACPAIRVLEICKSVYYVLKNPEPATAGI